MLEFSNRRHYFMERVLQLLQVSTISIKFIGAISYYLCSSWNAVMRSQLKSIIMGKPMSSSGGSPTMISDFVLKKWLLISVARLHRFPILCLRGGNEFSSGGGGAIGYMPTKLGGGYNGKDPFSFQLKPDDSSRWNLFCWDPTWTRDCLTAKESITNRDCSNLNYYSSPS